MAAWKFFVKKSRELIETAGVIRRREAMKIYIDFDDVLCETAEYFTKIAKELFGIDVPLPAGSVFQSPEII